MHEPSPSYCVIPGAGMSGLTWAPALELLDASLMPIPDEPDVAAMAAALAPAVRELERPRVLVGASLGAMVALELARSVPVDALVLIAAGFGIEVGDSLIEWVRSNPPDLFGKMSKASIAARDDAEMIAFVTRDFESRGQPVALRHLLALRAYEPRPLDAPPPTIVIWGERDRSVPLADHVELARQCRGLLAPVADAGHKPFLERPAECVRWIQTAALLIHQEESDANRAGSHPPDLG
jgi:pimeloyl-ACP methyl ester carboxylesterase